MKYPQKNKRKRINTQLAVALKHDWLGQPTPKVIASGRGLLAQKMIETAKEKDIPLYQDQNLAELLSSVEVDEEIPAELFDAVARVLAFIYKVDGQIGKSTI
jgi:flagellar biosynthesis protein